MKPFVRILAFLLSTVFLLGTAAGCASQQKPLQYVKKSLLHTLERKLDSNSIYDVLSLLAEGGSISASLQAGEVIDHPVEGGSLELFFAPEGTALSGKATLGVEGKSYDAAFWLNEKELAFSSEAFLGSDTFGLHVDRLAEQVPKSIFVSNSGTPYADQRVNSGTPDALKVCFDKAFFILQSQEEYQDMAEDVLDEFLEALEEYAPAQRYAHDGSIYVNVEADNAAVSRAMRDTWQSLVKKRRFCKKLRALATAMDDIVTARDGITVHTYRDELDLWLNHNNNIEALCAKVDAHPAFKITLNAVVRRTAGTVSSFALYYSDETVRHGLSFNLPDDSAVTASITTPKGVTLDMGYTVKKNGLRNYIADIYVTRTEKGSETPWRCDGELKLDRFKKNVELSLRHGEESRVLSGSFDVGLDSFEVSIDKMTVNGTSTPFAFSLAVDAGKDSMQMPQYRDFPTLEIARMDTVHARFTESKAALDTALADYPPTLDNAKKYLFGILGISM